MIPQYIASAVDALLEYAQKQSEKEGLNFPFKVLEKLHEAKAFVDELGFGLIVVDIPINNNSDLKLIIADLKNNLRFVDWTKEIVGDIVGNQLLTGCFNALTLAVYWLEHYKKM